MSDFRFVLNGEEYALRLEQHAGGYHAYLGERRYQVEVLRVEQGRVVFALDGQIQRVDVVRNGDQWHIALPGRPALILSAPDVARTRRRAASDAMLATSMPGTVVAVLVSAGERVEKGQTLVILEAMKMETRIGAPHAGTVSSVAVERGQRVERGQALVEVVPHPAA